MSEVMFSHVAAHISLLWEEIHVLHKFYFQQKLQKKKKQLLLYKIDYYSNFKGCIINSAYNIFDYQ